MISECDKRQIESRMFDVFGGPERLARLIGKNMREMIERSDKTIESLSDKTGVAVSDINFILTPVPFESGRLNVEYGTLVDKICCLLWEPASKLFSFDDLSEKDRNCLVSELGQFDPNYVASTTGFVESDGSFGSKKNSIVSSLFYAINHRLHTSKESLISI